MKRERLCRWLTRGAHVFGHLHFDAVLRCKVRTCRLCGVIEIPAGEPEH